MNPIIEKKLREKVEAKLRLQAQLAAAEGSVLDVKSDTKSDSLNGVSAGSTTPTPTPTPTPTQTPSTNSTSSTPLTTGVPVALAPKPAAPTMSPALQAIMKRREERAALEKQKVVPATTPATPQSTEPVPSSLTAAEKAMARVMEMRKQKELQAQQQATIRPAAESIVALTERRKQEALAKAEEIRKRIAAQKEHRSPKQQLEVSGRVAAALAKVRAAKEAAQKKVEAPTPTPAPTSLANALAPTTPKPTPLPEEEADSTLEGVVIPRGKSEITLEDLDEQQMRAVQAAASGKEFVLVGPAGSGKTTSTGLIMLTLLKSGLLKPLRNSTKSLTAGSPNILICSFTNAAVTNIKEAAPPEFKNNAKTIHKALEYEPLFFEVYDEKEGKNRKTMKYVPGRTADFPLAEIEFVILEEAGQCPLSLYANLKAACPNATFIFLGDLQQIPPVFGKSILGFKLLQLEVIALEHIYRTGKQSPIRELTYKILEGKPMTDAELEGMAVPGELEFMRFNPDDQAPKEVVCERLCKHFSSLILKEFEVPGSGFNYREDVILIPYNKGFGTIAINEALAQTISTYFQSPTYEIKAGFMNYYFAVGDLVNFGYAKWEITLIEPNANYAGKPARKESLNMDRKGHQIDDDHSLPDIEELSIEDMEAEFNRLAALESQDNETAFRSSSHIIHLKEVGVELGENETPRTLTVSTVGDVGNLRLSYAMTVHKAMGSEWAKVFCVFHASHGNMLSNEMLYTALTRARKFCRVYYSGQVKGKHSASVFQKGVLRQIIPGKGIEAKKQHFSQALRKAALKVELEKAKMQGRQPDIISLRNISDKELADSMLEDFARGITFEEEQEG